MQNKINKSPEMIIEQNPNYLHSEYLILKINSLLSNEGASILEKNPAIFPIGKYLLDTHLQVLVGPNSSHRLTSRENDLLRLLCEYKNKLLLRELALRNIWGIVNRYNARSMDVYITKIRKYLKDDSSLELINIHGKGFRLITGVSI
jgi:two-component system, OmpR family, response regulator